MPLFNLRHPSRALAIISILVRYFLVLCLPVLSLLPSSLAAEPAPLQRPQPSGQATLAVAAKAERDGRNAEAEAGYQALAAATDPTTAAQGALALGRFLVRQDRSADALAPLSAAASALGGTPDGLRAVFLLGEAQAAQHQNGVAASLFQTYRSAGGPAAGWAAIEQAWALQATGDDHGALNALAGALQATSPSIRRAALKATSDSLERLGDPLRAAAEQRAIAAGDPPSSERAAALSETARLSQAAGDNRTAIEEYLAVVQTYPALPAAGAALDHLDALGAGIDPLQRGLVLFDLHRNADAAAVFQALLDSHPAAGVAAKATFYLAALADRRDENDAALAGYSAAYTLDPNGVLAPLVLWNRAQLLQSLSRYDAAQSDYTLLAAGFPNDLHAADAAFNAGLAAYLAGRADDAAHLWAVPAQSSRPADAARANLWLGKLALARGDAVAAQSALTRAWSVQPAGYFGLRAAALSAGQPSPPAQGGALVAPAPLAWDQVETWLTSWAGPEDPAQFATLQGTQDWIEALELTQLGWKATPAALFSSALAGAARQPWALYRAARTFDGLGLTHLALPAALDLLDLAPGERLNAPAAILRLAYPVDYLDLVTQDAAQSKLNPLLLYAVIRQESEFDPAAGSPAGARGLAQLVPATAQDVATALGLSSFTPSDLTRPSINLQLGASYLAQQLQTAGGDLSRGLAAYNAGAGNSARWAKLAGDDPDLFYAILDFPETRLYIRLVSQNYAVYNLLYRGPSRQSAVGSRQ